MSHFPSQSTATPPSAVHDPEQLPEQLPSHATLAPASASHEPEQETSSFPPSHFGGLAFTSHFASTLQLAWQFASALNDALHSAGNSVIFGTKNGKLFGSGDAGDSWEMIKDSLPEINCVRIY